MPYYLMPALFLVCREDGSLSLRSERSAPCFRPTRSIPPSVTCTRYSGTCVFWRVCEGVYVGDGVLLVFQVWAAAFWKVSLSDSGINVMSVKCKLILFTSTVHSILSLTHCPPSLSLKPSHARTPLCRDLSDVNISTVAYACGRHVNSKEFVRPSPAEELDITTIPRGASCADALGWM